MTPNRRVRWQATSDGENSSRSSAARRRGDFVREPMSETLRRLPNVEFWFPITLLVALLVICLLGSAIELMAHTHGACCNLRTPNRMASEGDGLAGFLGSEIIPIRHGDQKPNGHGRSPGRDWEK